MAENINRFYSYTYRRENIMKICEYKKGEFCKKIECEIVDKSKCEYLCMAYQFHNYLIQEGYKIVKEVEDNADN
jgi:hypothetical protein